MRQGLEIRHVVLAGSGLMGASFAQIFAAHGYSVTLYDIAQEALDKAASLIAINQKAMVDQGALTPEGSQGVVDQICYTTDKEVFTRADFVLEAIVEKLAVKHSFWSEVSQLVGEDVVLATNTSGLPISQIAQAVKRPERFAGMHWVNPPHLIPLVEVIAGEQSGPDCLAIIRSLALSLEQHPVMVHKDPPGFVLNRLQYALLREACHIVEEGYASMEDVDGVMKYGLGMRYACLGPFETVDFGGMDIFYNVGSYLFGQLCNDTGVPRIIQENFEAGRLGVKSGAGFHDYSGDKAARAIAKRDADFLKLSQCLFGKGENA